MSEKAELFDRMKLVRERKIFWKEKKEKRRLEEKGGFKYFPPPLSLSPSNTYVMRQIYRDKLCFYA